MKKRVEIETLVEAAEEIVRPIAVGADVAPGYRYEGYDVEKKGFVVKDYKNNKVYTVKIELKSGVAASAADAIFAYVELKGGLPYRFDRLIKSLVDEKPTWLKKRFFLLQNIAKIGDVNPEAGEEQIIRLGKKCNQKCVFCPVRDHVSDKMINIHDPNESEEIIEAVIKSGRRRIVFSGGEPTLSPHLANYIKTAKEKGAELVIIQTNGVMSANEKLARSLKEAGLDKAIVSLHSHLPEMSDALTQAPGTHAKTMKGILNLDSCGVSTSIMHVINGENYRYIGDFFEFVRAAIPATVCLTLAYTSPLFDGWDTGIVPRLSDVSACLMEALDEALSRGADVRMAGGCGIPLCMFSRHREIHEEHDGPDVCAPEGKMKTEACAACSFNNRCSGIWTRYIEKYGADEFKPVL